MTSKTTPEARHKGMRFRIGEVFAADDPIARWTTVLSIAANDVTYVNVRMIEGDLEPALDLYYFRLAAAHFIEACDWLEKTPKHWPQLREFIATLPDDARAKLDRLQAFSSQRHPLNATLSRSRDTLFHYPDIQPEKERAGREEMANALAEAADITSTIEGGDDYASFRACYADEVAVQLVAPEQEELEHLLEELRGPMFELVEFAEAVLLAFLTSDPAHREKVEIFGTDDNAGLAPPD